MICCTAACPPSILLTVDLCRPHIFANTLDPVSELVDAAVPLLQSYPHVFDLTSIQDLGLDPVDSRNLGDLVDGPSQQAQAQRFHDEMLNVIGLDFGLGRNGLERHGAVMWWSLEDCLCQSRERDLLVQESFVLFQ